jgi:diaminopimelate epimerase
MHGLGNDYVYVSAFDQPAPADPEKLAIEVSDRHFGIGSDGLILILPSDKADARMRMFNADGSEGVMCGNGIRCVAKYVYDHGIARKPTIAIETGRGVLNLAIRPDSAGKAEWITVDMGEPILEASRIPTTLSGDPVVDRPIEALGSTWNGTAVSMGNPHFVIFVEDVSKVDLPKIGPALERHPAFPSRVNVHFVEIIDRSTVKMVTWERGSGITLACGTGACSVCVAGVLTGRTDRAITAYLPGGPLMLDWPADDSSVIMTGPATEAFTGEWPDPK